MSEQPINNELSQTVDELLKQVEEFRAFISSIESRKHDVENAFKDFVRHKNRADELFPKLEEFNEKYLDALNKISDVIGLTNQAEEFKGRLDSVEKHTNQQKGKIDAYTQTFEEAKIKLNGLINNSESLHEELKTKNSDLDSQIKKITRKAETLKQLEDEITRLREAAEAAKTGAETANQAIESQQLTFNHSIEAAKLKSQELDQELNALEDKISNMRNMHTELASVHAEIVQDKLDEQGSIINHSIKSDINDLHENFKKEYDSIKKSNEDLKSICSTMYANEQAKFELLHLNLSDKINSLLPGAGAASLASSYYQAKMRYAIANDLPSLNDLNGEGIKLSWKSRFPQISTYLFNLGMFIAPLVLLVLGFACGWFAVPEAFSNDPYATILYKTITTLPLLAISSYGLISLATNRRLYEEYNHKQRVMQLYHSFKTEIDKTGDNELKTKLLNVMLDVVRDKPAAKMSRYEHTFLNKLTSELTAHLGKK